ncbi:AAA family ATPase [Paenibacillus wulumuqiensis]|uniref:AAA family ATPase n=1 Tax=Paenibacillus wulumuqiensis TaxID=1567107 RepID=UPI000619B9E7|nr:AAA family ATPase [Paenibacillus wulumuqiensis]
MRLIILFGPQAVGKMTVGQHLAARTNMKLFHNHMSIDLVSQFFDYGTPSGKRLVNLIRREIFEEVSRSDLEGLIFTYVCAFDLQSDWDYIEEVAARFESRGGTVYYVELEADMEQRIQRNKTENRLQHKPTKRDIQWSEKDLIETHEQYRLNSLPGEIQKTNYLRINNTALDAEAAAEMIIERFAL